MFLWYGRMVDGMRPSDPLDLRGLAVERWFQVVVFAAILLTFLALVLTGPQADPISDLFRGEPTTGQSPFGV